MYWRGRRHRIQRPGSWPLHDAIDVNLEGKAPLAIKLREHRPHVAMGTRPANRFVFEEQADVQKAGRRGEPPHLVVHGLLVTVQLAEPNRRQRLLGTSELDLNLGEQGLNIVQEFAKAALDVVDHGAVDCPLGQCRGPLGRDGQVLQQRAAERFVCGWFVEELDLAEARSCRIALWY